MAALEAPVQQWREPVQQTARPSSSDPPHALGQRPRREPTGHGPGGQPGHEGQARALVPEAEVDVGVPVKPARCHHCQHTWQGEDLQPPRHQVTELPPIKPVGTEYPVHRLVCPAGGAADPGGVARGGADRRRAVERRLDAGQRCGVPKTAGTVRALWKLRQALWTCVRHDGVEPTHNAAERAIRPGVLWRQGSLGTQRAEGSRVVAVMLPVGATLKPPQRTVRASVTAACEAARCGQPAPSLLPTPEALEPLMRPAA